jgi:hypothetical protein
MLEINHNNLPQAMTLIIQKMDRLECIILDKITQPENDKMLTIAEAAAEVKLSVATLYGYVSRRQIPYSKPPNSKRLWFSKQDLICWMREGRKKTMEQISAEANSAFSLKKVKRS